MLRLVLKRQPSAVLYSQIKYFSKLSFYYQNQNDLSSTLDLNHNVSQTLTPKNSDSPLSHNNVKHNSPVDIKLSSLLEDVNKNALFTLIEPLIPDPDSAQIYQLTRTDRLPIIKQKKKRLPKIPKDIDSNTFNNLVYETTQFQYVTKELTEINDKYVRILYKFAMNGEKSSQLNVKFQSILDLIGYFAEKEEFKKVFPLMRKYVEADKEKEIKAYHALFNHLETSTKGFNILFQRLNTLKANRLKLDSYLIYKVYDALESMSEKQEFIDILKSKNIPITKIFGKLVELDQIQSLDQFNDFAKSNHIARDSIESHILQLRVLLTNNKNDEFIEFMKEHSIETLPNELVPLFIESFLKENRLTELWFYLKRDFKLNENSAKVILDHLYTSKQAYFILPFVSVLKKYNVNNLDRYAWSLIFNYAKDTFDKDNESYWLLMRGLVALCHLNKEKKNKLLFTHDMRDFLRYRKQIAYYDPYVRPESKEQFTLRFNLRFLYLWNSYNPRFNVAINRREFRFIARLFNPEVESAEVKNLKNLLYPSNDLTTAIQSLKVLISNGELNQYHLSVFINYYCYQHDLIGLITFITYIEEKTSFKVKFIALSQFASTLFNNSDKLLGNVIGNEIGMMRNVVIYLYQQTYIDSSIWTRRNNRIDEFGLDFESLSISPDISLEELQENARVFQLLENSEPTSARLNKYLV